MTKLRNDSPVTNAAQDLSHVVHALVATGGVHVDQVLFHFQILEKK